MHPLCGAPPHPFSHRAGGNTRETEGRDPGVFPSGWPLSPESCCDLAVHRQNPRAGQEQGQPAVTRQPQHPASNMSHTGPQAEPSQSAPMRVSDAMVTSGSTWHGWANGSQRSPCEMSSTHRPHVKAPCCLCKGSQSTPGRTRTCRLRQAASF